MSCPKVKRSPSADGGSCAAAGALRSNEAKSPTCGGKNRLLSLLIKTLHMSRHYHSCMEKKVVAACPNEQPRKKKKKKQKMNSNLQEQGAKKLLCGEMEEDEKLAWRLVDEDLAGERKILHPLSTHHSTCCSFVQLPRYTESFDKDEVLAISLMRKGLQELTSRQLRAVS